MNILFILRIVIIVIQIGFIYSQSQPIFRNEEPLLNLMHELPDSAFSSSSHREHFFPYLARAMISLSGNSEQGKAWCPGVKIKPNSKEYIQVDFNELKIFSSLFCLGLNNGNEGFFVSNFYLDYQRENGSQWHRFRDEMNEKIIKGNVDSRNVQVTQFKSHIVAKRLRIIPISNITVDVCMKFTLYGYNYSDGVVEYSIPQGDDFILDQRPYPLIDQTYDSFSYYKNSPNLHGGIGKLMDYVIDKNSITTISEGPRNFVGWQNNNKNRDIEMVFRFDKVRLIKNVSFHILNDFNLNISVFSFAKFEFSIGGKIYGLKAKNISFVHDADLKLTTARWVQIDLNRSPAKYIRITLKFRLQWIVITEMQFNTEIPNGTYSVEKEEAQPGSDLNLKSNSILPLTPSKFNYLLICFCAIITFVGVSCIISICILRFRRQRKRRIKGKPIRYGNVTCNNVIPIPVVSSSNGGLYKPIPNGVYDCMPGFQSQTLNVRKVANYPSQQLFGTYSNRKNSNSNPNQCITSISQDTYNATLNQIVGQQNMNLYCPENRRASYDGSYGTGSNPEYSNASLDKKTLPVHLVPLSPTMYEQYKINSNNHHVLANSPHQFNLMSPILSTYKQDSHPNFVDNFPVNSVSPIMNNYGQAFIYQPSSLSIDSSMIRWPDELFEIIDKHSRFDIFLQSPVGGSMIYREKLDNTESRSVKDYEEEVISKLPKVDFDKLELQNVFSHGVYGSTRKCIYNGSVVLVKAVNRDCVPSVRISFLKMISDLMKISSKNIANVVGYCDYSTFGNGDEFPFQDIVLKPSISCIIMQHTHHGNLHKFIRRHSRPVSDALMNAANNKTSSDTSCTSVEDEPDESNRKPLLSHSCLIYIAAQISDGMSYLEQEGLIHRDLSTRNCIVGPRLSILITDSAMDKIKFPKEYISLNDVLAELSTIGMDINRNINFYQPFVSLPLQWMSWEAVLKGRYSTKSDVWSFGILFWDLLTYCEFRPYFCVPQNLASIDSTANYVKCLSLLYNFKCLEEGFDNSLLPNNESLIQIRKGSSWTSPLPLPVPSQLINISSDRRLATIQTPRVTHQDNSVNRILDSNREIRDLIASCWSIEPSNRPKFKDINIFLRQKINSFNVEEEYQYIQTTVRRS